MSRRVSCLRNMIIMVKITAKLAAKARYTNMIEIKKMLSTASSSVILLRTMAKVNRTRLFMVSVAKAARWEIMRHSFAKI